MPQSSQKRVGTKPNTLHITRQIKYIRHRRTQAIEVRDYLATQPPLEYSDQAWNTLVDHVEVVSDGLITIHFKDHMAV